MWVLRLRDCARAAAIRVASRRAGHRVPGHRRAPGVPALSGGKWHHRGRACGGRVTNKKRRTHLFATATAIMAAALCTSRLVAVQRAVTDRVLVVPFENTRHEPRLQWLGEASAVLLEDQLRARRVAAITRDERV